MIWEECREKGGGGYWPSVVDIIYCGLVYVVSKGAGTFITELTKGVYKKYVKGIFEARAEVDKGKFERGNVLLKLRTEGGEEIAYLFPKFLTPDESYAALLVAKDHFLSVCDVKSGKEQREFMFDRQTNQWLEF